ncbi:ABC transporter substrate-binding protein [Bacteroidia bacterium]|nr:ABC transporter substrate-binding protein [Bacteroidia bacterium]
MPDGRTQNTGKWRSYLSYYSTSLVAEGNQYVFAVANGSLYSYEKEDNSLRYYSKENGLGDNQIAAIGFNAGEKAFVVAYSSGNIDLIGEDHTIYNIPFLMNSSSVQDKTINAIFQHNEFAYLSANFGIVVLNVKKREIKESYLLNTPVSSIVIYKDEILAATANGILRASLRDNLVNPANWHAFSPNIPDATAADSVGKICVFQDELCFLVKNKGIYRQAGNSAQRLLNHASLRGMKAENGKLAAFSASEIYIYSSFSEFDKGSIANISDVSSLKDNTTFWLAMGEGGLTGIKRTAPNQYQTLVSNVNNDCPKYNWDAFLKMHNRKLYIAGGGRWTDRFLRPASVMAYDTDSLKWQNWKDIPGGRDATCIAIDPSDENHLFVSTWGEGVFEIKDGETAAHFDHTNSALATIFPNSPTSPNYIRVEGVTFDKDKNLWMTNSQVASTIVVRKADGTWAKLNYPDASNVTLADKILVASNGHKWVNFVRADKSGIFVFDDKGTIDDMSDDESHYYSFLSDSQGNIGASEYPCLTEDKNGEIWIGTNRGPIHIPVPSRGVKGTMACQRIIYTDEFGSPDYFLKDERVNAIAVDGGNRKWIGTESSGLYLVGEDGTQVINHFTTGNSPLLSDKIQSLAINDFTGEVFIGTDKGLISYMGEATKGSADYSNAYAYPNPVRPGYTGKVIITGLMDNSNVKITDARGSLLFEGRSTGGQISWDCRHANGKAVAAGVYLVLSSTPSAAESVVAKIAVAR